MVDMGVLLGARNHQGKIYAVSRRCLFVLTHQSTKLYPAFLTKNFLMVQAPGFIRGINPKSQIENPQAPAFIRGVNLKSKI
jgi:hypothetical protein